jgi:hypothetical protein
LGEIYDRVWRAWELADSIGQPLDYGLPLDIIGFCSSLGKCEGKRKTAFWTTTNSPDRDPLIAFGDDTSQLADGNWPDNREYHEFGHHFMADGFGDAMPRSPGDENHAGYYVNPSSTDSWREGWAEFYSMMVAKHVDQEIRPELYRVEGVYLNLEFDYRPWMAMGTAEELAVAGLLLDLEDGPDDYATGRQLADLRIAWHEITTDQNGRLLIGGAVNDSPTDYSEQTMVAATFHDPDGRLLHTGWVATIPWDLPFAGGEGFFSLMLPEDLEWDSLEITAIEGRPGDVLTDDDPVDLTLDEIWQTIVSFTSQQQAGNGYVFDVVDLYTAFRQRYGGRDADGNGMDDIEQLFIAHGLFADTDGDRSFLHGNEVGRTDHAALMVPGLGELLPGWIPRRDLPPLAGSLIDVDTGPVAAGIVVQVSPPPPLEYTGYSYVTYPDDDGKVHVAVPPADIGGTVGLTAIADGYRPTAVGTLEVDRYWQEVEAAQGEAPVAFEVTFEPGAVGPGGDAPVWPWVLTVAGAGLVFGGGLAFWRRRMGRRAPG